MIIYKKVSRLMQETAHRPLPLGHRPKRDSANHGNAFQDLEAEERLEKCHQILNSFV